jgi:serine/threonine-protein kinase
VLTGRRLYRRETELATMRAILDDPIPRPSEVADVPPELDAVVMRALRKRRDARFASAHEMAQALERFAFSHEGFSPLQVASYMKGLFAAEFLQWRKTATAALDMEVDRGERRPRLETPGAEPPTQGPTMALRPGLSTSGVRAGSDVKSQTARSSRGAVSQATQTLPSLPSSPSSPSTLDAPSSKRDRLWVYGGLIVLVAITGYGAWMLTRSQGTTAPHDRPPPLAAPAAMSSPPVLPPPAASTAPATAEPPTRQASGQVSGPVPGTSTPTTAAPAGSPSPAPNPAAVAPAPAVAPVAASAKAVSATAAAASPAVGPAQQGRGATRPHPKRRRVRREDGTSGTSTAADDRAPAAAAAASPDKKADPFE